MWVSFVLICKCIHQIDIQISGVRCRSAVRFGQALPGFLITAPPSVCVSAVLVSLAVWIQNQKKKFIVCLYICVRECLLQNINHKTKHKNNSTSKKHSYVRGPLRECRSIRSGASGLTYYCAPLVCVSAVIDSLAVWRHNPLHTIKFIHETDMLFPC